MGAADLHETGLDGGLSYAPVRPGQRPGPDPGTRPCISRIFPLFPCHGINHLPHQAKVDLCLIGIKTVDGKPGMDDQVIAYLGLSVNQVQPHLSAQAICINNGASWILQRIAFKS